MSGLRERKLRQTKQAIVAAAARLFAEQGYEATTIAQIAAAADIGTRTFFGHFATKEDVLFPENDARIEAVSRAIADRRQAEGPADILVRALRDADDEMVGPLAELRLRLYHSVPAVQRRGLQLQATAQQAIAAQLAEAFPEDLDAVHAGALVGAFVGAVTGALAALLAEPGRKSAELRDELRRATDLALDPWLHGSGAGAGQR